MSELILKDTTIPAVIESGGEITIDTALSTISTNPVQNRAVTTEINQVKNSLTHLQNVEQCCRVEDGVLNIYIGNLLVGRITQQGELKVKSINLVNEL